jgi:hypothetical protein
MTWHELPTPASWNSHHTELFIDVAGALARDPHGLEAARATSAALEVADTSLAAATHVLCDLAAQGWRVLVQDAAAVAVAAPQIDLDPITEKDRVRRQELLKRDEQLATLAVKRFIAGMERPREFRGEFVSIFSLMRDGAPLARDLATHRGALPDDPVWRTIIDPYVQVVRRGERCMHTGLRTSDIWRYFRHTWTNQYTSTPGRSMMILVRDRAAAYHPVIGIAALGSSIVQIAERDRWIGWEPTQFLIQLRNAPTAAMARWITNRLDRSLRELYVDDLIKDGLYWPGLWSRPTETAVARLVSEAKTRRLAHQRFARAADLKNDASQHGWRIRAESDLFRSKRCMMLAELLRAQSALMPYLRPRPTKQGLTRALDDPLASRMVVWLLRRAKADSVGTEIADLTVCGAIAPYNALLGGKLVGMLAVSPTIVREYHERYKERPSEISSALAGTPVRRRSNLVFVGTTSLYGSGASQYNRLRLPKEVIGGEIVFRQLGRSRSFGTSHLSKASVHALVALAQQSRNGVRVNSIFGEGVSPKLRKVREGLDILGWPSEHLLQHHRQRIVYGVSLVENLLDYLMGIETEPRYVYSNTCGDDIHRITNWWYERWLRNRVHSDNVLVDVASHSNTRPVQHGARVATPIEPRSAVAEGEDLGGLSERQDTFADVVAAPR